MCARACACVCVPLLSPLPPLSPRSAQTHAHACTHLFGDSHLCKPLLWRLLCQEKKSHRVEQAGRVTTAPSTATNAKRRTFACLSHPTITPRYPCFLCLITCPIRYLTPLRSRLGTLDPAKKSYHSQQAPCLSMEHKEREVEREREREREREHMQMQIPTHEHKHTHIPTNKRTHTPTNTHPHTRTCTHFWMNALRTVVAVTVVCVGMEDGCHSVVQLHKPPVSISP